MEASAIVLDRTGSSFEVLGRRWHTSLAGRHNVANALAAIGVPLATIEEVPRQIERKEPIFPASREARLVGDADALEVAEAVEPADRLLEAEVERVAHRRRGAEGQLVGAPTRRATASNVPSFAGERRDGARRRSCSSPAACRMWRTSSRA